MVIAADYPFLEIFFTMILFFTWLLWIWMVVAILGDVFRRRDLSGVGKAAWTVFLIVVPFVGALVYLIAQHEGMNTRRIADEQAVRAENDAYVRTTDAGAAPAAEIQRARSLLENGTITETEFDSLKAKALA